jgi:hypothetical protein
MIKPGVYIFSENYIPPPFWTLYFSPISRYHVVSKIRLRNPYISNFDVNEWGKNLPNTQEIIQQKLLLLNLRQLEEVPV